MELWEHLGFVYYKCQCILNYAYFTLYIYWKSCLTRSCGRIGYLISFWVHWTYDDWTLSLMKISCDFLVYVYFMWFIICDIILLIFGNMLMNLDAFA
jgi:hypothetical protein